MLRTALLLIAVFCNPPAIHASDAAAPSTPPRSRPQWQGKLATYSIASMARRQGRRDWNEVTQGNKVVLPAEVLDYLTSRGLPYDKFQLLNPERRALRLFTGPLDFCAASGECYLPSWVMRQLGIKEGEICAVATANFPAAAYIKFQPHSSEFLDIGDHTAVLTRTIENLGGLTQGSYVRVSDGQRTYALDVLEVRGKPMSARDDSNGKAVSIGLLECPIEFETPKDVALKETKKRQQAANAAQQEGATADAEDGQGQSPPSPPQQGGEDVTPDDGAAQDVRSRLRARAAKTSVKRGTGLARKADAATNADAPPVAAPVPKFKRRKAAAESGEALPDAAFSGRARSLGGVGPVGESSEEGSDGETAESTPTSTPKSELARRRAEAKNGKRAADADGAAEGEASGTEGEMRANPGLVLVLSRALELVRSVLLMLLRVLRGLMTPGDVNFD